MCSTSQAQKHKTLCCLPLGTREGKELFAHRSAMTHTHTRTHREAWRDAPCCVPQPTPRHRTKSDQVRRRGAHLRRHAGNHKQAHKATASQRHLQARLLRSTIGGSMRFPVAKLPVHIHLVVNLIASISTAKLMLASVQSRSSRLIWPLIEPNHFIGSFRPKLFCLYYCLFLYCSGINYYGLFFFLINSPPCRLV